ncbi:MAG: peptidylprolyl isomerase, partial [Candidatus Babeliales bacterium]
MKTIITKRKHVISSCFLAASLLMLPGCTGWFKNWFSSTTQTPSSAPSLTESAPQNTIDPNDPVLLYIDNEPMLTLNEFQKEVETLIASNPDLANIFELIPQANENLLTGLVNQRIIDAYIKHNKIDQTAEYQQELATMVKSVQRLLNSNFLQKELNVSVTARDIKQFYDENKDKIPDLKISAGGYKTQILKFESEDKAQQFLAKAKQLGFEKAASEDHLSASINNLRMVSAQTPGIDPQLKKEILNVTRAPST